MISYKKFKLDFEIGYSVFCCVALLGFLISLLLYHPGSVSEDSIDSYKQALANLYTDSNPPLMAWVWHLWIKFSSGAFGMLFLQLSTFWVGLWLFIETLPVSYLSKSLLAIGLGFYPTTFGILGVIWKDNQMLGSFMLGFGLLRYYFTKPNLWLIALACLAFCYGSGVRYNAMAALPGILFGFIWMHNSKTQTMAFGKRFFINSLKAISAALFIFTFSYKINGHLAKTHSTFSKYYKIWDIIGIAKYDNLDISNEQLTTSVPVTKEIIDRLYTPRQMGPMLFEQCEPNHTNCVFLVPWNDISQQEVKDLNKLWMKMVLTHPIAYFQHRLGFFAHVIGATKDPVWAGIYTGGAVNDFGLKFETPPALNWILGYYSKLLETEVYRVWVYLIVLFVGVGIGFRIMKNGYSPWIFATSMSGLLYLSTYFILAISSDFRYSNWTILCALLVIIQYLVHLKRASNLSKAIFKRSPLIGR